MESHFSTFLYEINKKHKQIIEMSRNNDYTTGTLLEHKCFSKHYKLVAIDLSKQIELENPDLGQKINFSRRLEESSRTMFFIIEKKEETAFDFSQNSLTVLV